MRPKIPIRDRLLAKIREDENGCWVWIGAVAYHPGPKRHPYGVIAIDRVPRSARRVAYEAFGKEPPLGNQVCNSTCGNPLCINPEHLVRGEIRKSPGPKRRRE